MIAEAHISTDKASKYLKWLCGHFKQKVEAAYDEQRGNVQFGFGTCEMQATPEELFLQVQAGDSETFARVKFVVGDHLERFGRHDNVLVTWTDIS